MINPNISPRDKEAFNDERQYYPPPRVRQGMETLWLKSEGVRHQEICRLVDISSTAVTQYLMTYQALGLDGLRSLNFRQQKIELEAFGFTLAESFGKNSPASVKQAMSDIEGLTGLKRSENRVRLFLISLGMKRHETAMIPAKADAEQQEAFKKNSMNRVLKLRKTING